MRRVPARLNKTLNCGWQRMVRVCSLYIAPILQQRLPVRFGPGPFSTSESTFFVFIYFPAELNKPIAFKLLRVLQSKS
jgi:hypothetical protein